MTASGCTLSRLFAVKRAIPGSCPLASGGARTAGQTETHEGVEAFASRPPVVSEAAAAFPPFAGGAVFGALPSDLQGLARCF